MKKPYLITITGADARVDVQRMRDLSREYSIEWGILLSPEREGTSRYPTIEWIVQELFPWTDLRLSAHLCGNYAETACQMGSLMHVSLDMSRFQRVQINRGSYSPEVLANLSQLTSAGTQVICQARESRDLSLFYKRGLQALWDKSGGRGQLPDSWPNLDGFPRPSPVGLAGGLTPGNVRELVHTVFSPLTEGKVDDYWIDVETGVRSSRAGHDQLDLDLVQEFCEQAIHEELSAGHVRLLDRYGMLPQFDPVSDSFIILDDDGKYLFKLSKTIPLSELDLLLSWGDRQRQRGQVEGRNELRGKLHSLLRHE